jgi:hypothetical protein
MDSFGYLYVALAVVAAALASIAIWSHRRTLWKSAAVGLLAALIVIGYFSYSALLSRPKPLRLDLAGVTEARVISAALREDEAIYLWLSIDETPRFFAVPWDKALAQRLQTVMRETRRSGHDVVIRPNEEEGGSEEGGEDNPVNNTFYAVPPPIVLPEKRLEGVRGPAGEM